MKLLISACLLGDPVRYDGKGQFIQGIEALKNSHEVFKFCPEMAGGLPVPRDPAEIRGSSIAILKKGLGGVFTKNGEDLTESFINGAQATLKFCLDNGIEAAVLKERSPSCGLTQIYDGNHQGVVITGTGLTAALLLENGIRIFTEDNFKDLI